jgi:DNA sulfur modification protein DndE
MQRSNWLEPPRSVRITNRGRDQLITIKRRTGIENWNTICRWGLVLSLREMTDPPGMDQSGDSSVEMSWEVFGGPRREFYRALAVHRMIERGVNDNLSDYLRIHIHRGIQMMSGRDQYMSIRSLYDTLPELKHQVEVRVRGDFET